MKSDESISYKLGDETKLSAIDEFDLKSSNSNKTDEYFEDKYISSEVITRFSFIFFIVSLKLYQQSFLSVNRHFFKYL